MYIHVWFIVYHVHVTLLASFFLPSHLSFKNMYISCMFTYIHVHLHTYGNTSSVTQDVHIHVQCTVEDKKTFPFGISRTMLLRGVSLTYVLRKRTLKNRN